MAVPAITLSRWLTLGGYFGLMAGIYAWHILIQRTEAHLMSIVLLVQIGPLLFPLFGLLGGKVYTHAWSMYLAIFYFIMGIWYGAGESSLWFGIYTVATSLLFFTGCVLYTRMSAKQSANERE